jgi:hypothetical protein
MRKILITRTFGAGWTTWNDNLIVRKMMISYQPIIDALEQGEQLHKEHPIVLKMVEEIQDAVAATMSQEELKDLVELDDNNKIHICVLGARHLKVVEVEDEGIYISEYDGAESILSQDYIDEYKL